MSEQARQFPVEPDNYGSQEYDGSSQNSGTLKTVGDKTSEYREKVVEVADKTREQAATGMESVADRLHEQAANKDGLQADAAEKAAVGVEKTAAYLKEGDTQKMVQDLETYVRSHPVHAVGAAIVAGFFIGRILK